MSRVPKVQSLIKSHLQTGNLKYLEPALELGYDKLPRTRHYIKLLKKGFLFTANHHLNSGDLFRSLSALEYARNLTPYDPKLLKKEFKLLERIFDQFYPDFVNRDLQVYRGILRVLQSRYLKRFPNIAKVLESLDRRASRLLDHASDAIEGKFSYRLEELFIRFYCDLNEEQREEIADSLAPYLPDLLKKINELEKEKKKDKPHNKT